MIRKVFVLVTVVLGILINASGAAPSPRQLSEDNLNQYLERISPAQASHFQDQSLFADVGDMFGGSPGLSVYDDNMWGNYLKPVREVEKRSGKRSDLNALLAKLISMSENGPRGRVTRFRFGTGK